MPTTKIITEEGKVDYILGTKGSLELDILANRMETTPLDKVTYEVPNDLGKHVPMTYCAVQSIEEGEDYYRQHFPRIPDILYPAMARYSFGDLSQMTKKDFERMQRKAIKKMKKENSIKFEQGEYKLNFE